MYPLGRTNLYYDRCQSSYRPKLICANKTCRKSIKPVYDAGRNEYQISELQGWSVRPLAGTNIEFDQACSNGKRIDSSCESIKAHVGSEWREREALKAKFGRIMAWEQYGDHFGDVENVEKMEAWELEFLRNNDPESWWLEVIRLPATYDPKGVNRKRCSGCGEGVWLVGSNFRIPKKKDNKAWRRIEDMVENGEDMLAKFSPCPTVVQHMEMVEEALRLRKRAAASAQWDEEKQRRIAGIKASLV